MGALFVAGGTDFCLDDAWIHLSYAKSLLAGDGLSYNPGDHETGFSSPLWVLLLAAWPHGSDPVVAVKMLGVLFHAASAWLGATLALELAVRGASLERPVPAAAVALLAGSLVATQPHALVAAVSGMEVSVTSALLLGFGLALVRNAWGVAALVAALSVWARPESLAFVLPMAGLRALEEVRGERLDGFRDRLLALLRRAGLVGAAALAAMAAWMLYTQVVSGHPLPNTFYVKTQVETGTGSWSFFVERVAAIEPWLLGVGGLLLLALAVRGEARARRGFVPSWILAWLLAMLAIGLSRPLNSATTFYESRYFAIFGALPLIAVALGWAHLGAATPVTPDGQPDASAPKPSAWPRRLGALALLPVVLLSGTLAVELRERTQAQEVDIRLLHTDPAEWIAHNLPDDARIAVEGAGAIRHRAPRSMRVIDALGLNDRRIAHAPDTPAKVCALIAADPTHFALPDQLARPLARVFDLEPLEAFVDPHYSLVDPPIAMRVQVYRRVGTNPAWLQRCSP